MTKAYAISPKYPEWLTTEITSLSQYCEIIDPTGDSHVTTLEKASVRTTAVEQTYSGEKPDRVLLVKYEERKVQWKRTSNPILTYTEE